MKWLLVLVFAVIAVTSAFPVVTFAVDPAGLVTCEGVDANGIADCNFCSFIQMVDVIVNWLFSVLVLIAVFLIVYAGFKLVVSAGNPSAMTDAKGMISNVIIGFVIILAAWLIVDTVLKALVAPDLEFGMWNDINACR